MCVCVRERERKKEKERERKRERERGVDESGGCLIDMRCFSLVFSYLKEAFKSHVVSTGNHTGYCSVSETWWTEGDLSVEIHLFIFSATRRG